MRGGEEELGRRVFGGHVTYGLLCTRSTAILPRPGTAAVGLGANRRPLGVAPAPARFAILGDT
jgi:hypothetical protein